MQPFSEANQNNRNQVLASLRENPVRNAWPIQDLSLWPESSRLIFVDQPQFSYLHFSGHPATHGTKVLIADGRPDDVHDLLKAYGPKEPFVIRETSANLSGVIHDLYPSAKIYFEQRMDVTRETFSPRHTGLARKLTGDDAGALAEFFGAPREASGRFVGWLRGARAFMGVFDGQRLLAIGSSMVSTPDAWNLVSIETHKEFRGKGHGSEVTSSLVAEALKFTPTVCVTVVKENIPALRTYGKVGFRAAEERIWVDNGTGSTP